MTKTFSGYNCRTNRQDPKFAGFTLIELVTVLAVVGILLSIGIPSLSRLVLDSRRASAVNELLSTLAFARSQAISTRQTVAVCRAGNGGGAGAETCSTSNGGWENGWIVFVDKDRDGTRGQDETVLRQHQPLASGSTLRGNSKLADAISFGRYGGTSDNGRMVYCDQRGWTDDVRIVIVATTGRVRVTTAGLDNNSPLAGCLT